MTINGILFTDLAMLTESKSFDALAPGTFWDKWGEEVTFTKEDIALIASNTQKAIDSTLSESGELVGLPIDAFGHDQGDGAGWMVKAELSESGILRVTPKWTDIGKDLITRGIRRFFSASIDLENRVLFGGTLTNYPAVRSQDGSMLLKPIELSKSLFAFSLDEEQRTIFQMMAGFIQELSTVLFSGNKAPDKKVIQSEVKKMEVNLKDLTQDQIAELSKEYASTLGKTAELSDLPEPLRNAVQEHINKQTELQLKIRDQERKIAEFADSLIGGSEDETKGLPIDKNSLVDLMKGMKESDREKFQDMLQKIRDAKVVEFEEKGHNRKMQGTQQLPDEMKAELQKAIDKGISVDEFFKMNAVDLGSKSEYDLSEFQKKED